MSVTLVKSLDNTHDAVIPLELNPQKTIEEKRLSLALSMRKF